MWPAWRFEGQKSAMTDSPIVAPITQVGANVRLFDVSSVVSRTNETIRRRWAPFLVTALVFVSAPTSAIHALVVQQKAHPHELAVTVSYWAAYVGLALLSIFYTAWVALITIADASGERRVPLATQARRLPPMAASIIATALLYRAGYFGGLILFVVPGIMLAVAWCVAMSALLAEGLGPRQALGRSVDLTRGNRWPIFALIAGVGVGMGIGNMVIIMAASGSFDLLHATRTPIVGYVITPVLAGIERVVVAVGIPSIYVELARIGEHSSRSKVSEIFA